MATEENESHGVRSLGGSAHARHSKQSWIYAYTTEDGKGLYRVTIRDSFLAVGELRQLLYIHYQCAHGFAYH